LVYRLLQSDLRRVFGWQTLLEVRLGFPACPSGVRNSILHFQNARCTFPSSPYFRALDFVGVRVVFHHPDVTLRVACGSGLGLVVLVGIVVEGSVTQLVHVVGRVIPTKLPVAPVFWSPAPSLGVDGLICAMCRNAVRELVSDAVRMASDPHNANVVRGPRTFPEVNQNVGHDLVLLGLCAVDDALHISGVGVDNYVGVEVNDRFRRFHLCQEEEESLNDGL
jgi:hypothetical protein